MIDLMLVEKFVTHHEDYLEFFLSEKVQTPDQIFSEFEKDMKPITDSLEKAHLKNHYCNCQLWGYEDRARNENASDTIIAMVKRVIDKLNQERNNQIEVINTCLIKALPEMNQSTPMFSETPGSVFDRLSILQLKIFHMDVAAKEAKTSELQKECLNKLAVLKEQKQDLKVSLGHMFEAISLGTMHFKQYHQYKMYNDKRLNPYLNGSAAT